MLLKIFSLFFLVVGTASYQGCPWKVGKPKPWNEGKTWPGGSVPKNGSVVTIKDGMRVLFNVPVDLASLTIEKNAELIWADLPDLELRSGYILVKGAFHLGSAKCRFRKKAFIRLTGRSDSNNSFQLGFNTFRKTLTVQGGTLELHGQVKTSWTRLAQSIPILSEVPCAFVYDHSDHEAYPIALDRSSGLHVMIWNEDGTVFDYAVYRIFTDLKEFITTVPRGKIIGMFAFTAAGLGSRKDKTFRFDVLDDVIKNDLGGQLISNVNAKDSYSLLTRKGFMSTPLEYYKKGGRLYIEFDQHDQYLRLTLWDKKRAFEVATTTKTQFQYFRVLHTDAAYPILELADRVITWQPGDKIVVASTDFQWEQAEVREIVRCSECSNSQIRVNASFNYRHYGNITYHVDQRAEVGMLTRSIVIEGVMEDKCYFTNKAEKMLCTRFDKDTFGADVRILKGFESVYVQGVELYHVGKQNSLGSYPLHFHMAGKVRKAFLKDNSIHHSFSRCITVHATDRLEVSGNVCYDHLGHGYFLEDSVEQNNIIKNNLGIGTRHGTLLLSDNMKEWCKDDYKKDRTDNCGDVSTFWITHPNNDVTGNAAAGGVGHGFMYVFGDVALGLSWEEQKTLKEVTKDHAKSYPIKTFYNNAAHSYAKSGVFMDSYISSGGHVPRDLDVPENGVVQEENEYDPRDPPGNINGTRVWTTMERITTYKNMQNNMWIKGGNIRVIYSSMGDPGSQSYSGGCTGFWTGTSLEHSVVIGRTDNLGMPRKWNEITKKGEKHAVLFEGSVGQSPWKSITGIGIYQGPMYIKHTYFDKFQTTYWADNLTTVLGRRPTRHAAAVSFKMDSTYPTYTSQYTTNLTFGFCDNTDRQHFMFMGTPDIPYWEDTDGPKNAYNWDRDGSLTGTPGTAIVRNRDFYTGPECMYRKDWNMSLCPYRYIKVDFKGRGGSFEPDLRSNWVMVGRRDDAPDDHFYQEGKQRREYLARTHKSFLMGFNTTLDGAAFPSIINIYGYGVEKQDVVRVGLCVPKDLTTFDISSEYPVPFSNDNYTKVDNLKDLDADKNKNAIFHDKKNGIIFFKVFSFHDRTNDSQLCSAGNCYRLRLQFLDGDLKNVRDCLDVKVPPYTETKPRVKKITKKSCKGIGSPEGLGAVRWNEIKKIIHKDYSVPCVPKPKKDPVRPNYIGCFVEETQDKFEVPQHSKRTMTVDWCIFRCNQRKYKFAGLSRGSVCTCSNFVNTSPEAKDVKNRGCSRPCTGSSKNKQKTCGDSGRMDVWSAARSPILRDVA